MEKRAIGSAPFEKLMVSLGHLLLSWSDLEEALIDDIRRLRSEGGNVAPNLVRVRGSFSERLAEWRALLSLKSRRNPELAQRVVELGNQVEQLHQKRLMITNQFGGASADPGGEPFILCWRGERGASNSDAQRITQSELTEIIAQMDRCRQLVRKIETAGEPEHS